MGKEVDSCCHSGAEFSHTNTYAMELRIAPVIRFVTIVTALLKLTVVSCVPTKYEIGYRNSIDLDAEQTEARYDQGMLSDIMNDDQVELQKAESCVADNFKYDHGQKIQRYDPCEICLCIDGEIFCWWKQCDVPTKPELSGNPAATIDTTSQLQLTNPSSTNSTTTTLPPSSLPSSDLSQLSPYLGQSGSTSTTTTVTLSAISSTIGSVTPDSLPAVLPSTSQDDAGGTATVRILHPPPPESIPQNILSFPQTPPIMMYRPVVPGLVKNGTSAAIPPLTSEQRNKHRPLKKVNPPRGSSTSKKPFRKTLKSKEYAINFGQIDGNTGKMAMAVAPPSMTERITSGPPVSFDEVAGRLTVGDRNDGHEAWRRKQEEEEDDEEDDDDEEEEEDDDEEDGSAEAELRGQIYDGGPSRSGAGAHVDASRTGRKGSSSDDVGGQFGGYGYGMFKEPDEDKQPPQHYIITSSGHVEMFDDDTSMEATENAFGLNRFPVAGSTTGQPTVVIDFGDDATGSGQPVAPLITMTTNVTQNWNYSGQQQSSVADSTSGQGAPPLTPYVPLDSGSSGRSVIDVLNSTTVDGVGVGGGSGGLDYLDDNQTELIYPVVPGLSGGSEEDSSSRRGGSPDKQKELVTLRATTTTTTGVIGASESSFTTSASSVGRVVQKQEKHCVVMGVSYKVGSVLKQETGNCLHCVCVAGPENDPVPRVTCTPLNCPPLILPDILDGAGF